MAAELPCRNIVGVPRLGLAGKRAEPHAVAPLPAGVSSMPRTQPRPSPRWHRCPHAAAPPSTRLSRRCLLAHGRTAVHVIEEAARPEAMATVNAVGRKEEKRRKDKMGMNRKGY
uniref:Uncharacterized protein n=1 Tax=Oryza rufipogon TaxID=4529 RepID=A0A0E0R151_ORYRU